MCNAEFCKNRSSFTVTSQDGDSKKVCSNHIAWSVRMLSMPGDVVFVTLEPAKCKPEMTTSIV